MQRRGRSRQVSQTALARQASEERHRSTPERRRRSLGRATPPTPSSKSQKPTTELKSTHTPPCTATDPPHRTSSSATFSVHDSFISSVRSATPSPTPDFDSCISTSPTTSLESPCQNRSLEDDIHVAYALDDIHLAKVLLLKLKGIEVSSDDDPRIAAVQDEDFDLCFAPAGRLTLDEEDEKALLEAQRRERKKWEERLRSERLRACERIWEKEKSRLREEKLKMQRKREEQALEEGRRKLAREREAEAERAKRQQRSRAGSFKYPPPASSYGSLPQSKHMFWGPNSISPPPPPPPDPFQYEIMMPTGIGRTSPRRATGAVTPRRDMATTPTSSSSSKPSGCRSVSFKDVLSSMEGSLFPIEPSEQTPKASKRHVRTTSQLSLIDRQNADKSELLSNLLKVVEWEEGERRRVKGKRPALERPVSYRSWTSFINTRPAVCAACSAASSSSAVSTPSSSAVLSRSNSWLSFGSRGSSSTGVTSPSTSPRSSWLKSSSLPIPTTITPSPPASVRSIVHDLPILLRHSCHSRLTVVHPDEYPLEISSTIPISNSQDKTCPAERIDRGDSTLKQEGASPNTLARRVRHSVSSFVELAKGLQTAYINVAVFSVVASYDSSSNYRPRSSSVDVLKDGRNRERASQDLKPPGYRVRASDVNIFAPISDSYIPPSNALHFIPLTSPRTSEPYRTALPTPLPLVFPPQAALSRSPFRPHTPPPPGSVVWRIRPIANPALLRLRALQNVLWERGCGWEGRGRDGGLGCGKERVVGVAFEGLGPSCLSTGQVLVG